MKNQNININDIIPQKWILNIIEKNSKDFLLSPLDNSGIYKNNEVICDADFELITNDCYKLFILGAQKNMYNTNYRKLPVFFLIEKYIVFINTNIFWILFKEKKSQNPFEILLKFIDQNNEKKILFRI